MSNPLLDAALLSALTAALYHPVLRHFFSGDDTVFLQVVETHSPLAYVFDPAAMNYRFYTPWFLVTLDIDRALFGLEPFPFYVHQLLALALSAILISLVLRRWANPAAAFVGAALFLVGPPVAGVVGSLWCRHYVEGLSFALLATLAWFASVSRPGVLPAVLSASLYLLALSAKEIYVPLPFLLLAAPEGRLRSRLRAAAPMFVTLVVFGAWRAHMLRSFLGAYDEPGERIGSYPARFLHLAASLPGLLVPGRTPLVTAALLGAALALFVLLVRNTRDAALLCTLLLLLVVPLIPVADSIQIRYLLLPWAAVSGALAIALSRGIVRGGWRRALAVAGTAVVLAVSIRANRSLWAGEHKRAIRSREEALFYFERSAAGDVLRQPIESDWFFGGLRWLHANVSRRAAPGRIVFDDWAFCAVPELRAARVYEWSETEERVTERPGLGGRLCNAQMRRLREDAALDVRIEYDGRFLRWRFGPERPGRWAFLAPGTFARNEFPRVGTFRMPIEGRLEVTVRFESDEGWLALSDPLVLTVTDGRGSLVWSRGSPPGP
ncbi:MAG: hypothetical protein NEA02_06725 [Thermoanaerobaculia bacterium]|nr:hypothetical protein [Thermoanaerobaculia bacterium]